MTLVETLAALTARTPSGGGFWLGTNYLVVRYSSDLWEWEYRGNSFYDLQDLAEEILRRSGPTSRLGRYFNQIIPDQRREHRA